MAQQKVREHTDKVRERKKEREREGHRESEREQEREGTIVYYEMNPPTSNTFKNSNSPLSWP